MEVEAFRAKAKAWLAENASKYPADPTDMRARGLRVALWDAGLLGVTLDPAYGGQGLSNDHQKAFNEEARAAGVAIPSDSVTVGICAPTLLDFANEEQIGRHVPAMIKGEEVWTQLLSEPGAGSDLAGLQTKAVLDGEEWVITGQKVWTSGAMQSDYALCIARSNPDVPKHAGLSMFIVPLRDHAGVTIRPLRQMNGEAHFNEVFLDEVRVPPRTSSVPRTRAGRRSPPCSRTSASRSARAPVRAAAAVRAGPARTPTGSSRWRAPEG